jgi:hypothetical protein
MDIPVGESFIGPKENLLEPYELMPTPEQYAFGQDPGATTNQLRDMLETNLVNRTSINY